MIEEFLLEETVGQQKKRAIVMVGRINPPTVGHYKVINAMKSFIRDNPDLKLETMPIVVVVAGEKTSQDKSKNPLTADERIKFMKASGRANGVIFLTATTGFAAWEEVRKAGYEPIVIAAGSDRAKDYKNLLDKYFKSRAGQNIDHVILPGLERDVDVDPNDSTMQKKLKDLDKGDEISIAEISGSMARAAVESGYEDAFAKIVGLEKKPKLAGVLFRKIKQSMGES